MRTISLALLFIAAVGCNSSSNNNILTFKPLKSLREAREGFVTRIVKEGEPPEAPAMPVGNEFRLIQYP